MVSSLPRKQRKAMYDAKRHTRARQMSVHLSDELMRKYGMRSVPVRKGDVVRIMRGIAAGKEGKVVDLYLDTRRIAIEGINMQKADKKEVARKIHSSNVLLINPDMTDKWRIKKMGVRE